MTLKINGTEEKFGPSYKGEKLHSKFWYSGGSYGILNNYSESEYVNHAPWVFNRDNLPEQFQEYYDEITEVFNNNVAFGCCGGCL